MLKFASALIASALVVQPAFATLDEVSTLLAKGRNASFEATTRSTAEPIFIEAQAQTRKGQEVKASASASPEEFAAAVRAKVAPRRIQSAEYTYQLDWEKVTSVGTDGSLPIYDLVAEIKDNMYDPKDANENSPLMDGSYGQKTKMLSINGPIVSMRVEGGNYFPGAAHPNYWQMFRTYDVRRLDKSSVRFEEANLLDVVEEVSLVRALQKDSAFAKLIAKDQKRKFLAAKTLREMEDAMGFSLENCYSSPIYDGKLSNFAIYSYDTNSNEVSVRVALGAAAHVCQAEAPLMQLGLKLKPTPEFRKILVAQVQARDGLFMSSVEK